MHLIGFGGITVTASGIALNFARTSAAELVLAEYKYKTSNHQIVNIFD